MKEEQLKTRRQQDLNLREALRMDEAELPQLPAGLNARVMQHATRKPRQSTLRHPWTWMVAACVAAFIVVLLTPPKEPQKDVVAENTVAHQTSIMNKEEKTQMTKVEAEAPQRLTAELKTVKAVKRASVSPRKQQPKLIEPEPLPAEAETSTVEEPTKNLAQIAEPKAEKPTVTLTERDIPITRPENYKYTPEELALMKKQANEAYLKWVELELEIAKHNLEQTAQK